MSAAATTAPAVGRPGTATLVLPAPVARLAAFAALAGWGALHWSRLVAPAAGRQMGEGLALALAAAIGLLALGRGRRRHRTPLAVALVCATAPAAAAAAGVAPRLLVPGAWWELVAGLASGAGSLPDLSVPYGGADDWPRLAITLGGALLLLAAAGLAFWPGRGGASLSAALALSILYGVPAALVTEPGQFLRGAAFAALLAAFLWLERVRRSDARGAAALVAAAIAVGGVAAPRLDASGPWVDYESLAESLGTRVGVTFQFEHRYGPMRWPRDGRELFRVRAAHRAYWKAVDLDVFDGTRWVRDPRRFGASLADELPAVYARRRSWNQRIRVTIQALRSTDLVAAGTAIFVDRPPSAAVATPAPGTFRLEAPLSRRDSYGATVYDPRPTGAQLAGAGTRYPDLASRYLELTLRPRVGAPARRVVLPAWGAQPARTDAGALSASPYARAWALSRRLARASRSPYDYVRHVLGYLSRGYAYSEVPPPHAVPLEAFLFEDRAGYCQQFSGAMALLLRMAGVPARVAAGFSPGSYDRRRREWIVRDLDAHSWVEAYFPRYGWVVFDPTPTAAPARSQIGLSASGAAPPADAGQPAGPGDRPESGPPAGSHAPGADGAGWLGWLAGALAALAVAAASLVSGRRRPLAGRDPALDELERALRRAGQPAAPGTTLQALERRFAGHPGAAYLGALRAVRFGYGEPRPSAAQRRSLRRALGRGRGLAGRARALWALPPHAISRRPSRTRARFRRPASPGP
ncbi:MAG: transglutaminaseTgpA domain-containing protein [Solirubrobacteraceae bacterium]